MGVALLGAVTGCSGSSADEPDGDPTTATTSSADPGDPATGTPTTDEGEDSQGEDDPAGEGTPSGALDAVETFYAWLETSRIPEPEEACAYLTPELQQRMLDEFEASGFAAGTCEELTVATAELYRATGASAEVDVQVVSESAEETVLFVTYLDGGDCGTVVLEPAGSAWLINQNSEGCDAP